MAPDAQLNIETFNGGEISPRAQGRLSLPQYKAGAAIIQNLIPNIAGGLERRPGTRYVAAATGAAGNNRRDFTSAGSWLVPFDNAEGSSYAVELSDYKMRFYRDEGVLLYSFAPFKEAQVNANANQLEIAGHGFYHGQKITLVVADGGVAPNNLTDGTTYHVVLMEALRCLDPSSSPDVYVSEPGETSDVNDEMGPYRIKLRDINNTPVDTEVWVHTRSSATQFTLTRSKGGSAISSGTNGKDECAIIPTLAGVTGTFRLAPVASYDNAHDLRTAVIDITDAGTGGGHFEPADLTEAYEIDTPWSYEHAQRVQFSKDGERMVMFGGLDGHPPHELLRIGEASFVLQRMELEGGPLGIEAPFGIHTELDANIPDPRKAGALGLFTADATVFRGTDIGRPLRKTYTDEKDGLRHVDAVIERLWVEGAGFAGFKIDEIYGASIAANGTVTLNTSDTLTAGEIVWFSATHFGADDFPSELDTRTPYYVVNPGSGTFNISLTEGGSIIIGIAVTAGFRIIRAKLTAVDKDDISTPANHGFADGTEWAGLWFNGIPPVGLGVGYAYKIKKLSDTEFRLQTMAGAEVPIGSKGSGKFTCSATSDKVVSVRARLIRRASKGTGSKDSRGSKTHRWRMGVWNAFDGWPGACTIHHERLLAGGSKRFPMVAWSSQQALFNDFAPDTRTGTSSDPNRDDRTITESSGWSYLLDEESTQRILWMFPSTVVIVATAGPIHQLEGFTPTTIVGTLMTSRGASTVRPVVSDAQIIWGSHKHNHIFSAGFEEKRAGYVPDDLTLLADHIFSSKNKLVQMALQEEPWSLVWAIREDGLLFTCTYDQLQGVKAWARQPIGGSHSVDRFDFKTRASVSDVRDWAAVKSMCSIPSSDQKHQQIWMVVERHAGGVQGTDSIYRSIEYLTARFESDDRQEDALFVDCAAPPQDLVAETPTVTVHDVLFDRTLDVWADGAAQIQPTAGAAGLVTLDLPAQYKLIIGIPYDYEWTSLSLESILADIPTAKGIFGMFPNIQIHVVRSIGGSIGSPGEQLQKLPYGSIATDIMGEPIPLKTGMIDIEAMPDSPDRTSEITVSGDGPGPFFFTHIIGRLTGGVDGR